MREKAALERTSSLAGRLGPWSLISGGLAFGLFWGSALFDVGVIWPAQLALHGLGIVTTAFGLIQLQRSLLVPSALGWVGVALTVVGSFASFPLLGLGLTVVATELWRQRGWRAGPSTLIVGSAALLASYALGARVGMEDAQEPTAVAAVLFGGAIFLISLGLVLLGERELHANT